VHDAPCPPSLASPFEGEGIRCLLFELRIDAGFSAPISVPTEITTFTHFVAHLQHPEGVFSVQKSL